MATSMKRVRFENNASLHLEQQQQLLHQQINNQNITAVSEHDRLMASPITKNTPRKTAHSSPARGGGNGAGGNGILPLPLLGLGDTPPQPPNPLLGDGLLPLPLPVASFNAASKPLMNNKPRGKRPNAGSNNTNNCNINNHNNINNYNNIRFGASTPPSPPSLTSATLRMIDDNSNENIDNTINNNTNKNNNSMTAVTSSSISPLERETLKHGKIFVGALSQETTDETLRGFFGQFGQVIDSSIKIDANGKSRGFAFVTFADPHAALKV